MNPTDAQTTRSTLRESLNALKCSANMLENTLPDLVKVRLRLAAEHSPTPWNVVRNFYLADPDCTHELRLSLAVRAGLAEAIEKLEECLAQVEETEADGLEP